MFSPVKNEFLEVDCESLKVGQIVMVKSGQTIPADMILVQSSDPYHKAYLIMSQLNGESGYNVKTAYNPARAGIRISERIEHDYRQFENTDCTRDIPNRNIKQVIEPFFTNFATRKHFPNLKSIENKNI